LARFWRWLRFGRRPIFSIAPDRLGPVVNGIQCLTLSQASLRLWKASGKRGADGGLNSLVEAILQDNVPIALLAPAPYHADPLLTGDVVLDRKFWRRAWFAVTSENPEPSDEWIGWLLAGGIVAQMPAVDAVASALAEKANYELAVSNREAAFRNEGFVRTTFPLLWTTVDALVWIAARQEVAVATISSAFHPLNPKQLPPWQALMSAMDRFVAPDQQAEQCLQEAMMDLARHLYAGRLDGKEWPLAGEDLRSLSRSDFARARYAPGTNSAGLLGGDLVGRSNHYVLFWPDDIRRLWPKNQQTDAGTREEPQRPISDKKKPGPVRDPAWAGVIAAVTESCIAAGYQHPLRRGAKAAIQTMLLDAMAELGKDASDSIALRYAGEVIEALPHS